MCSGRLFYLRVLRFLVLAAIFAIELTLLTLSVDGQNLLTQTGFAAHLLGTWGMPALRFLISTAALGGTFIYLKKRPFLDSFGDRLRQNPIRFAIVALHLFLFGVLLAAGRLLYGASNTAGGGLVTSFVAAGALVALSGLAIIAPPRLWIEFTRATGALWACAGAAALVVQSMTTAWRLLWAPTSYVTYQLVAWMLRPIVGNLMIQPERMRIATDRFGVIVSPECSGMEGMGLLLLFGGLWLWFYRKECRFPQALLLLPAGLVTLFLLNSLRIAALFLIGHEGAAQIAIEGFHSEAGWIAFNGVAFGLCVAAGRVQWIAAPNAGGSQGSLAIVSEDNMVAVYLGPFLAILAAGMLARAMTGGFEWMYPLRVVAPCAVLWYYRLPLSDVEWGLTWWGPATGLAAFAVWIGFEWILRGSPHSATPIALAAAGPLERSGWIAIRVLGATAIVPVAEELAFRGFLMRRLVTEDFSRLAGPRVTATALVVSSVLFGAMHGSRWIAGAAAGLLYGWVYRRRGRLGDAVAAHAVTNALIAAGVLALGWWKLW